MRFRFFQLLAFIIGKIPKVHCDKYDLVIVRVDALGDYILWLDALGEYKNKYKGEKVLLICADIVAPLAEQEPFFTKVIHFNRRRITEDIFYFIYTSWEISQVSARETLYPIWQRHRVGDVFVSLIDSIAKIGMRSAEVDNWSTHIYDRLYTNLVDTNNLTNEIKAIEHFTQSVVNKSYIYGKHKLFIHSKIKWQFEKNKYVVVALSASIPQKVWPMERFGALIDFIPNDMSVILIGAGIDDVARSNMVQSLVKDPKRLINMVNKTTVVDMVRIISKAILVIGNDSAAVHIAAATHVRSICLMHGAHFGRFLPYPSDIQNQAYNPRIVYVKKNCFGCGYNCIYKPTAPFRCLDEVSVDMVKEQMEMTLFSEPSLTI